MKKLFLSLLAFLAVGQCLKAQEMLDTWSVYDVDKDTKVNVQDVTKVVDRAKKAGAKDQQVVDAAQLNAVLVSIMNRLSAIENKLGIANEGHEYVDLGLSVKWATCNVGAEKPEDAGLFYAWGETEGYTADTSDGRLFDWTNYKWMNHTINDWQGCLKYTCADGKTDAKWYVGVTYTGTEVNGTWLKNLTTLQPDDDAATANWGGSWRMPTNVEIEELQTKCEWTWNSTKKGYSVKGPNGNSIFLPASGSRSNNALIYAGIIGGYWSSKLDATASDKVIYVNFDMGGVYAGSSKRSSGRPVRPVCP